MKLNGESETIEWVNTLTFDIFGTVLDLAGSLVPPLEKLLQECNAPESLTGADVWNHWRLRQRLEQYQDNIIMLGHSGYLEVKKRALLYTLRLLKIEFTYEKVDEFMKAYHELIPFQDAVAGLKRLGTKYRLVILSNGEEWYLKQLVENNIGINFNEIIVYNIKSGKPSIKLLGNTKNIVNKILNKKKFNIFLSLSDENKHSIAFVIIDKQ